MSSGSAVRTLIPLGHDEIKQSFKESARDSVSTLIWPGNRDLTVETYFLRDRSDLEQIWMHHPSDFNDAQFEKELSRTKSRTCYLSLSLTRANLLFKSDFIEASNEALVFKRPEVVYRAQRRRYSRHRIPDGYKVPITFEHAAVPDMPVKTSVYDVSIGGIGFLVPLAEEALYYTGLKIAKARFHVAQTDFKVDLEVRNTRKVKVLGQTQEQVCVGTHFLDIHSKQKQVLVKYITDESRKLMTKLVDR